MLFVMIPHMKNVYIFLFQKRSTFFKIYFILFSLPLTSDILLLSNMGKTQLAARCQRDSTDVIHRVKLQVAKAKQRRKTNRSGWSRATKARSRAHRYPLSVHYVPTATCYHSYLKIKNMPRDQ